MVSACYSELLCLYFLLVVTGSSRNYMSVIHRSLFITGRIHTSHPIDSIHGTLKTTLLLGHVTAFAGFVN
jgi:hypothetical protein